MKKRMKVVRPKPVTLSSKPPRGIFLKIILFCGLATLIATVVGLTLDQHHKLTYDEKVAALGLEESPYWVASEHVKITENFSLANCDPRLIPIHIMYRKTPTNKWVLKGTGKLLEGYPGWLVTAYHVMEGTGEQYGFEHIGPEEFRRNVKVVPITGTSDSTRGDDTILCSYDTNRLDYPNITVRPSPHIFKDFEEGYDYPAVIVSDVGSNNITFPTRPNEKFKEKFRIQVKTNTWFMFFEPPIVPGESGTIGKVENERDTNALVVAIRRMKIPKDIFPQAAREQIGWESNKYWGVVEMFKIE